MKTLKQYLNEKQELPEEYRIKQRHEDSHYECAINRRNPLNPAIGYGVTQEEADTKCLNEFLEQSL